MRVLTVIEQFEHASVSYLKGQVICMEHLIDELIGLGHHAQHFVVAHHDDEPAVTAPSAAAVDDKAIKSGK